MRHFTGTSCNRSELSDDCTLWIQYEIKTEEFFIHVFSFKGRAVYFGEPVYILFRIISSFLKKKFIPFRVNI